MRLARLLSLCLVLLMLPTASGQDVMLGPIADLDQRLAEDRVLKPDDIAANYLHLHHQKRSAWTHEMDLRPWSETW